MINFDSLQGGYSNIARTKSSGVELSIIAELLENLNIRASYTYSDATDLDQNSRLPREPKHRFSGAVNWTVTDDVTAIVTVTHNGQEEQNEFSPVPLLDSWTRVDFKLSYDIMDDLSIFGRVDNILNEEYQHVLGYGTPDRSFFAGVRKTF